MIKCNWRDESYTHPHNGDEYTVFKCTICGEVTYRDLTMGDVTRDCPSQIPTFRMSKAEIQYLGVVSLLTRIAGKSLDLEDKAIIKQALDDCAAVFPGRFEVIRTTARCGYSLEPLIRSKTIGPRR